MPYRVIDDCAIAADDAAKAATAITLTLIFLFSSVFHCQEWLRDCLKRVLLYSNADDGAWAARRLRLQQPASCSPDRHIRLDHFVILKISCRKAPRISTCPAFHRLEPSRRPAWTKAAALLPLSLNCYRIRHPDEQMCRIREAENSSGSPRGTERFFNGNSKKHWVVTFHTHAIPTSEVGEDETGPRSTRDNKRYGNADRRRRLIERPVQPLEKHANFSPITNASGARFAGAKTISGT